MTDNDQIKYEMTMAALSNNDIPLSMVENLDLTNGTTQRSILECKTSEQLLDVLKKLGGEY